MNFWNRGEARLVSLAFPLTILLFSSSLDFPMPRTSVSSQRRDRQCKGQTAAQPEGTVLNLVNWVGNVIAPEARPWP